MNLALPTTSHLPLPKYHRVFLVLHEQLADGRFAGGVPGELQLVKQFGVARVTIRRALAPGWFISAPASHTVSRSLAQTRAAEVVARIKGCSDILVHPALGSLRKDLPLRERHQPMLDLAAVPETRPDSLPLCLSSKFCLGNPGLHQPDRRSDWVCSGFATGRHWPEVRQLRDRCNMARGRLAGRWELARARLPAVSLDQRRHAGRRSGHEGRD